MEAQILERQTVHVLGYLERIDPMNADYSTLWSGKYMPHDPTVRPLAVDPGYYGVYFGTEEPGRADFLAGMAVDPAASAPEALALRSIPGGTYAAFGCAMANVGQTWRDVYGWLPNSGYAEDPSRPCFEYYPPGEPGPTAPVTIFIPVTSAQGQ